MDLQTYMHKVTLYSNRLYLNVYGDGTEKKIRKYTRKLRRLTGQFQPQP